MVVGDGVMAQIFSPQEQEPAVAPTMTWLPLSGFS